MNIELSSRRESHISGTTQPRSAGPSRGGDFLLHLGTGEWFFPFRPVSAEILFASEELLGIYAARRFAGPAVFPSNVLDDRLESARLMSVKPREANAPVLETSGSRN